MKKTIGVLLALFLLASLGAAAAEKGKVWDFQNVGITMEASAGAENLEGVLYPYPYGNLAHNPDVYYMSFYYFAMPRDEFLAVMSKDDLTEEEAADFRSRQLQIGEVIVGNAELGELLRILGVEEAELKGQILLSEADGYCFYYLPGDISEISAQAEPYASEAYGLANLLPECLKGAVFAAPVDPMAAIVGQTVKFESTDLEGNAVSSADLFAGNKITMINYWATWCHNCVDEMSDLAEIHTRLQEKGCGVIGILQDGTTTKALELAQEIMSDKGTNYPNVLESGDMEFLQDVNSFPTTFFVDSEGTILCFPIVGASVSSYESTVDALLAGETVGGFTKVGAGANDEDVYRVIVVDSDGQPVKGVAIQFCDDSTCNIGKTDENGVTAFELPDGSPYIVHILKVPEGFEKDSEEYHTLDVYSDVVIVLKRAE